MACRRRRPREDGGAEPDITTGPRLESPHFFKFILSDTLQSGKLGIPKKFLGSYGKYLSSLVLLKVPGSSTWTIGLEKHNNDAVWLWKGWREFMQHYSVVHGQLVVFKYKGNSTFRVMIFDKSASEINYSSSGLSSVGSGFISPKREDVVKVEDSEDPTPHKKTRVEPCSQLSPSRSSQDLKGRNKQSRCRMNHSAPVLRDPALPRPLATPELASEFDSKHPFFKMVIRQGHLNRMRVPGKFSRHHIQGNKESAALMYTGRSWPVKLVRYPPDARVYFSAGWAPFARKTHLRVGNACVFELIDRDDVVFKVSIFNNADEEQIHID